MVVVGDDGSESVEIFCFRKSIAVGNVVIFAGSDVAIVLIFSAKCLNLSKVCLHVKVVCNVVFVVIIEGLFYCSPVPFWTCDES